MTLEGIVRNGLVELPPGFQLPDGTHVSVVVSDEVGRPTHSDLLDFAGVLPDLPADFAEQHDHYIHGTPRR